MAKADYNRWVEINLRLSIFMRFTHSCLKLLSIRKTLPDIKIKTRFLSRRVKSNKCTQLQMVTPKVLSVAFWHTNPLTYSASWKGDIEEHVDWLEGPQSLEISDSGHMGVHGWRSKINSWDFRGFKGETCVLAFLLQLCLYGILGLSLSLEREQFGIRKNLN